MKPIIEKQAEETILTSEITNEHIIVAFLDKLPLILTKNNFYTVGDYGFASFLDGITKGAILNLHDSIQKAVESLLFKKCKIEVFEEKDWKKALQWLIDNAE